MLPSGKAIFGLLIEPVSFDRTDKMDVPTSTLVFVGGLTQAFFLSLSYVRCVQKNIEKIISKLIKSSKF